jgi:hypothetical protein
MMPRNDDLPAAFVAGLQKALPGKWAVVAFVALASAAPAAAAMIPEPAALLLGLDKITARVSRIEAPVGTPVRFGTLKILVRACETNPPDRRPENAAFLEIDKVWPGEKPVRLFSGWMFSSSPALSALEDPIYDVSVLACNAASAASPALPPGKASRKTAR